MDPTEQQHKLAMIRTLTAGELAGWHRYCTAWRQPFPGEIIALMDRAKTLGVSLPAARSVSATASAQPPTSTSPSMKF
jgi:hypothetical protein